MTGAGRRGPVGSVPPEPEVLAAGGVVHRSGPSGPEVLVVHRPRYDDWTLPKGKLDPGETLSGCALREVAEETGLRCRLGEHLADVRYVDHLGRSKLVRYWAMTVESDDHEPDGEVDEVRWLPPSEARNVLSYDHDHAVIDALEGTLRAR
jgi:8-oxo-dGTP pyrophosphatase MutT (NUDIX family)